MSKTIIITAHGRMDTSRICPPLGVNLLTHCKPGEPHVGVLGKINEFSMFKTPNLLYEYIFSRPDYTSQGEWYRQGSPVPNVVLSPLPQGQMIKNWSWQKSYVLNHYRKECVYDLKTIPNSPYATTDFTGITLPEIQQEAERINFSKLSNRINLIKDYDVAIISYTVHLNINNHLCALTRSVNGRVFVLDYEIGPSCGGTKPGVSDDWCLNDAIQDIRTLHGHVIDGHYIDLNGVDSIVLKTCLSS